MLAKQALIIGIIIPLIEYFCFIAVKRTVKGMSQKARRVVLASYLVFSIVVLLAFFAFRFWATIKWPDDSIKHITHFLLAVFLGKFVIASIMLAGDIFAFLKRTIASRFRLLTFNRNRAKGQTVILMSVVISKVALVAGVLFTAMLTYGMTNKYKYKIRYVPIHVKGLPEEFKNFRIVQISDIHAGSFDSLEDVLAGVEMALRQRPDLIVFTGDLVNYRSDEIVPYLDVFNKLQAPLGVYSILGNHDYGDYRTWPSEEAKREDFEKMKDYHKALGWNLLLNEHEILTWKNIPFALIGVENWSIKTRFPRHGDIDKAMEGLENKEVSLKILLTHDPSHWDAEIRPKYPDVDLTLSGHTHGFQMGIEIPGIRWSPAQYLYKQWAGLYRENDQYLYVNRGFGFNGYEGRLGILPEITVIEIN